MGGMTDDWTDTLAAVVAAGADAVEVGIPFSDPMIDGPVIQEASVRALARGTVPGEVLDGIALAQLGTPVAVMTYYNIIFRAGHKRMARSLAAAGVAGTIVPDLPLEELEPWAVEADAAGVDTVLLVAPSSPPERVARICARCPRLRLRRGEDGCDRRALRDRRRRGTAWSGVSAEHTDMPVCVGVGVSTPAQAAEVCRVADGVVVGSALVRRLLRGAGPEGASEFVSALRQAID